MIDLQISSVGNGGGGAQVGVWCVLGSEKGSDVLWMKGGKFFLARAVEYDFKFCNRKVRPICEPLEKYA